jgi:hypothetical protein
MNEALTLVLVSVACFVGAWFGKLAADFTISQIKRKEEK